MQSRSFPCPLALSSRGGRRSVKIKEIIVLIAVIALVVRLINYHTNRSTNNRNVNNHGNKNHTLSIILPIMVVVIVRMILVVTVAEFRRLNNHMLFFGLREQLCLLFGLHLVVPV